MFKMKTSIQRACKIFKLKTLNSMNNKKLIILFGFNEI